MLFYVFGLFFGVLFTSQALLQLGFLLQIQLIGLNSTLHVLQHAILGMTGDNHPRKPYIRTDSYSGYYLILFAFYLNFYFILLSGSDIATVAPSFLGSVLYLLAQLFVVALAVAFTAVLYYWKIFFLFKIYGNNSVGAGFNLYYRGFRRVGLDWHDIQIRQDLQTGKPLQPEEQYKIIRPHIDLPDWNLHHWPWAQTESHAVMEQAKAGKQAVREAKAASKEAKKARRAAQLAARSAPTSPMPGSPLVGPDDGAADVAASAPTSPGPVVDDDDIGGFFPQEDDEVKVE